MDTQPFTRVFAQNFVQCNVEVEVIGSGFEILHAIILYLPLAVRTLPHPHAPTIRLAYDRKEAY